MSDIIKYDRVKDNLAECLSFCQSDEDILKVVRRFSAETKLSEAELLDIMMDGAHGVLSLQNSAMRLKISNLKIKSDLDSATLVSKIGELLVDKVSSEGLGAFAEKHVLDLYKEQTKRSNASTVINLQNNVSGITRGNGVDL